MRFWDASAVNPLLLHEPRSDEVSELIRSDPAVAVWWGTRVECVSAIRRRESDGTLDLNGADQALSVLGSLAESWAEVGAGERVRSSAVRLLAVHRLRAGDALQLGAAITWRNDLTARREFVCLDERLRDAAQREGFALLPAG